MTTTVRIDPELCCCSGSCELAAPDLFAVPDDGGAAVFLLPVLPADRRAEAAAAARACPTGAISL